MGAQSGDGSKIVTVYDEKTGKVRTYFISDQQPEGCMDRIGDAFETIIIIVGVVIGIVIGIKALFSPKKDDDITEKKSPAYTETYPPITAPEVPHGTYHYKEDTYDNPITEYTIPEARSETGVVNEQDGQVSLDGKSSSKGNRKSKRDSKQSAQTLKKTDQESEQVGKQTEKTTRQTERTNKQTSKTDRQSERADKQSARTVGMFGADYSVGGFLNSNLGAEHIGELITVSGVAWEVTKRKGRVTSFSLKDKVYSMDIGQSVDTSFSNGDTLVIRGLYSMKNRWEPMLGGVEIVEVRPKVKN